MRSIRARAFAALAALAVLALTAPPAAAQVTNATMRGIVTSQGAPVEGARVEAVHEPSGSRYNALTRSDGRYTIPAMRVGGPYRVTAQRIGLRPQTRTGVTLALGVATEANFTLEPAAVALEAVTVQADATNIETEQTGAATQISSQAIETLPTISRRIQDFTRLTPQANGSSFAGVDSRLNNITIDGSFFNNSFGLGSQPGDRTGVAPVPLDAIEQIQVSIAPFDVRQGAFVGAAVNTVTRSGTNEYQGSLYYFTRNETFVGDEVRGQPFNAGTFDFQQIGGRLGGPIIKDKLFFFLSYEDDTFEEPATTFRANPGGQAVTGNTTRVLESDLNQLSDFLRQNFDYETGGFQGYPFQTPSTRFLGKIDYNLNDRNRFSFRYSQLESSSDVLASNSSSLGAGSRRTNLNALNFANTNYAILENIKSFIGEYNATIGENMANQFIAGYNESDESRQSRGTFFPLVDIRQGGDTYTSFGFEPFTPNNELRYSSWQVQNNFTIYANEHEITLGGSLERYESENVFFPGSQSVYVYSSLDDFYADANDYLANPNRTISPVELELFQVRYANIPGQTKPIQPLEVLYGGVYAQDVWRPRDGLSFTLGLRVDVPRFGETGFANPEANALTFRDELGNAVQYRTEKLPDANPLFSPRFGFNWDVQGDGATELRGGTGLFSGRPAYVWISNQIGNNGIQTGFIETEDTQNFPFNPDPNAYKPTTVTGAPAEEYNLALTDPNFRFPQVWRTNLAIERRLPFGFEGTLEGLYSRDVNGIYYINANLPAAQAAFTGPDDRPRYTSRRLNENVTDAIVLKNQNEGYNWNVAASLQRAFTSGLFTKVAYSYGDAYNTVDAGSIASGSYFNNPIVADPNNPGVSRSGNALGHRFITALSYNRQWFDFGATGVSLFLEGQTAGFVTYRFSNDLNGDGGRGNDLIYVPANQSEMNFAAITDRETNEVLFTPEQQATAFEEFINSSDYLRSRRGQYAERNGERLPLVWRGDLSLTQDLFANVGDTRNSLQFRLDVINFTNLLNDEWGVGYGSVSASPLSPAGRDAAGAARYRLATQRGNLVNSTRLRTANLGDVWRLQLGVRYIFN